mgnify:FL=1
MKTLTIQETELLSNILFNDCSYLEDCTEEEFQLYQNLRASLDNTLYEHNIKVAKAQEKQPKAEW